MTLETLRMSRTVAVEAVAAVAAVAAGEAGEAAGTRGAVRAGTFRAGQGAGGGADPQLTAKMDREYARNGEPLYVSKRSKRKR